MSVRDRLLFEWRHWRGTLPEGPTPAFGRMAKGTSSYGPNWRSRTHWWNRKPPAQ
jgi:hypothetical protein